ncbi:MAG: hypothetical protein PWP46_1408 [Fusobacteriaceae bacterium]|jgi:dihydrofolate reductase|nr:hypothetical protein [Fusobacteriaceae bacterium]
MSNIVYIATSLDGYIARENGEIDWLNNIENPDNSDFGFNEFISRIDAIVMGRKTYEIVTSFGGEWPYIKPVFVLTNTLNKIPDKLKDKVFLINGEPEEIIKKLNKKGYRELYIDGGTTINSFLKNNLIDELIITRVPIILGSGIPLFNKLDKQIELKHIETISYNNGLVKSVYIKK